ncbi:MAG: TetR family transcriptional regulator [Comamonadaceae bacterium CG12_big_fil_rev_8_21_14_0_65_59_15]|nr:MAG: TetR family transcriptional regulator [Comamonadaceae bacterium CG12_big_fil_rev_8_21_14_0_65_59_15]
MQQPNLTPSRRGHRPRRPANLVDSRELLLRSGLEVLTEKGFSATGIDEILGRVAVPKGSFYYYFTSKEAFGLALIDRYADFFAHKIDRHLNNTQLAPVERLRSFVGDAMTSMARFDFRRGCLIGNLGQEMGALPESFRARLQEVLGDWQARFAVCLAQAQEAGALSKSVDVNQVAAFFWIGWEGAVLRAKLEHSPAPLELFADFFFAGFTSG